MRTMLFAAVAALSLAAVPALADGDSDPFPFRAPGQITASVPINDTGSEAYPSVPGRPASLDGSTLLAGNGAEAPVQTRNSLPALVSEGVAYAQSHGGGHGGGHG